MRLGRWWPWRRTRTACLSLGSNLGDRLATLRVALDDLDHHDDVDVETVSAVYETDPITPQGAEDQPHYLNLVAVVTTTLGPRDLLDLAHRVEAAHGRDREREERWGPRSLDIDLLLYDHEVIDDPEVTVPHPRLTERAFVLVPLAEVLPAGATLPDGATVASHLARLAPITGVELYVRLTEGPGTTDEPLNRRPPGPPGGPPRLSERHGGPGMPRHRDPGAP